MASLFGHAFSAIALNSSLSKNPTAIRYWLIAIVVAILPDIDVLSFKFGISYQDVFGHRGITHSLFFAFLTGIVVQQLFFREYSIFHRKAWVIIAFFFLITASHGFLDAMTNGGYGVAFFAPFDNNRFFLPWRPLQVSPIGMALFFSEWGIRVICSEMIWIGIPGILLMALSRGVRSYLNIKSGA